MTPNPFTRTPGQPRDPARIDIVLAALRAYWLANPDLRLGQIVVNAADGGDPFGIEDDALMAGWPEVPEAPPHLDGSVRTRVMYPVVVAQSPRADGVPQGPRDVDASSGPRSLRRAVAGRERP